MFNLRTLAMAAIMAAFAMPVQAAGPQAADRGSLSNFKDMVLANCIAQAYRNERGAAADAGSSASALRDWTYFDLDQGPQAVQALIERYLARDYSNPLVEAEIRGIRFDLLKCMDLYHSPTLAELARRVVVVWRPNPR